MSKSIEEQILEKQWNINRLQEEKQELLDPWREKQERIKWERFSELASTLTWKVTYSFDVEEIHLFATPEDNEHLEDVIARLEKVCIFEPGDEGLFGGVDIGYNPVQVYAKDKYSDLMIRFVDPSVYDEFVEEHGIDTFNVSSVTKQAEELQEILTILHKFIK